MPKKFLTAGLALLTLIIGFFGGSYYTTQKQSQLTTHGIVTRIIDADTLELDNKQSIRLYAVSCPEKGQKLSDETVAYLKSTALNQPVTLDYQLNYTKDSYGRTLAFVFINDTHLNEQLIQAQNQAKQEKLGRWQ